MVIDGSAGMNYVSYYTKKKFYYNEGNAKFIGTPGMHTAVD